MRYERLTDNMSLIVGENGESRLTSSSLEANRDVCKVRKFILYLLSIQLFFTILLFMADARLFIRETDENRQQAMRSLPSICISFIYYGCGLVVVYRYHHLGIYTFTWLGFLQYLSLCAEVFINTVIIIKHPSHNHPTKTGFHMGLMITILSTILTILMVITLKVTFRLLDLIKIFKREVLAQM